MKWLCNAELRRIKRLGFCVATDLFVTNTFFRKRISQLITYNSGGCTTQFDYILVRRTDLKLVKNARVIGNKECFPQQKLAQILAAFENQNPIKTSRFIAAKKNLWTLHRQEVQVEHETFFVNRRAEDFLPSCVEDAWKNLNSLSANPTKWSNTLKQFADKLFECVWPFCKIGAQRVKECLLNGVGNICDKTNGI